MDQPSRNCRFVSKLARNLWLVMCGFAVIQVSGGAALFADERTELLDRISETMTEQIIASINQSRPGLESRQARVLGVSVKLGLISNGLEPGQLSSVAVKLDRYMDHPLTRDLGATVLASLRNSGITEGPDGARVSVSVNNLFGTLPKTSSVPLKRWLVVASALLATFYSFFILVQLLRRRRPIVLIASKNELPSMTIRNSNIYNPMIAVKEQTTGALEEALAEASATPNVVGQGSFSVNSISTLPRNELHELFDNLSMDQALFLLRRLPNSRRIQLVQKLDLASGIAARLSS